MLGLSLPFDILLRGVLLSVLALVWVMLVVRLIGLRSFSKMTAFDFVVTLAAGSLVATAASSSKWAAFGQALVAIGGLLSCQMLLAIVRKNAGFAKVLMENKPMLLMRDGVFLERNMRKTRVARSDIAAKLREANVLKLEDVRAVVLETTGDISVLHGEAIDSRILEGVDGN